VGVPEPPPSPPYPKSVAEFDRYFPSDDACREYLTKLRWPTGFCCRKCGVKAEPWGMANGLLRCRSCKSLNSVLAGTIFQDTKQPLRLWFLAAWQVTCHKSGVSALGLQRALGLNSYKSAWTWLHKFRKAMVRPGRDRLHGLVEVDETLIGAPHVGRRGRSDDKTIVVVAAEDVDGHIGRIRLATVPDASSDSLMPFVTCAVEAGSTVRTDGWTGYNPLESLGYGHVVHKLLGRPKSDTHKLLPHVHLIASLLKRWLLGTHHGGVDEEYLDYYLDEFTFRFNRRTSASRGLLFYRLLQQAVQVEPMPYRDLTL